MGRAQAIEDPDAHRVRSTGVLMGVGLVCLTALAVVDALPGRRHVTVDSDARAFRASPPGVALRSRSTEPGEGNGFGPTTVLVYEVEGAPTQVLDEAAARSGEEAWDTGRPRCVAVGEGQRCRAVLGQEPYVVLESTGAASGPSVLTVRQQHYSRALFGP